MAFHVPEKFRFSGGPLGTDASHGNNGLFFIRVAHGQTLRAIASDGGGWEHVSVSRSDRCPTWEEMCQVKAMFWDGDDCVVQYHPPETDYVNNHPYCLHMWRSTEEAMPAPPSWMVGIKSFGVLA